MNLNHVSRVRRMRDDESGQSIVLAMVVLFLLFAMAAFTIDMGNLYFCYTKLVSNTQAAANAGGTAMSSLTLTATTEAKKYSGSSAVSALYNVPTNNNMTIGTPTIAFGCITGTNQTTLNLPPCVAYPNVPSCGVTATNPAGGCNAIKVTETAVVKTFFAGLFGVSTLNIAATATAGASGSGATPYNIMLLLDTTASMGSGNDTGCVSGSSGSYTPEQCAQFGVQTLLSELAPCAQNLAACGSNPPVDQVGLMVFPGLCSSTATKVTTGNCPVATTLTNTIANATYAPPDYSCPSTAPPIAAYNNNPEYLILGFQNNYRLNDTSGLNQSSSLFGAVGAGTNNCGVQTPGGEGTFYAGAIYAARDYLFQNHRANVQDILIFLSDGDPTASGTQLAGTVKTDGLALFTATAECTQAVTAANSAKGAPYNIDIYSVSYGSETTGCTTGDSTYNTPCKTMEAIASNPVSQYFYSVPQTVKGVASTVCTGAVPITKLDQVFTTIAANLETPRLIPNGLF